MESLNQQNLVKKSATLIPQFMRDTNCLQILQEPHLKVSKTKKICTLGPKSSTVETLLKLMDHGMNVARLNFSHGTHESHAKYVEIVRQVNKAHPTKKLAILLDTKGPEIRTGRNFEGKTIHLNKGQQLQITIDYNFLSTQKRISCSYSELISSVAVGSTILFSDGQVSTRVLRIDHENKLVIVEVLNDGKLGQKKNMCLPGCAVKLPTINSYDENDIVNFGLLHKIDFIAVSFARYRQDIEHIRKILAEKNPDYSSKVRIISKIQNRQALQNIDEIIQASDGIMVARGDLGMQTPLQKLILLQKLITSKCINQGKILIIATQMVDSMQTKPRPTRAEVSDIANSVLDLADCIMTSGQTANGQFPVQTVSYMNKISIETERVCDYQKLFQFRIQNCLSIQNNRQALNAVKIVRQSLKQRSDIILLKTVNLELINWISAFRPLAQLFVLSQHVQQMQNLTKLHFAVSSFDESYYEKPKDLIQNVRQRFGSKNKIKILRINGNFEFQTLQISLN